LLQVSVPVSEVAYGSTVINQIRIYTNDHHATYTIKNTGFQLMSINSSTHTVQKLAHYFHP